MKKFTCILLSLLLLAMLLAGCGEKTPAPGGETEAAQTNRAADTEGPESGGKETQPAKRPLEERFAEVKCEVLARTVVPAETVKLYGGGSAENATVLTLRLLFPDWDTQSDCGKLRILDPEGSEPAQNVQGWTNRFEGNPVYANVYLAILDGDVEAAGLRVVLKEAYGYTEAEIPMEAGSGEGVYEALHEAFPTKVVRAQGRTYFVANTGAWSTNGETLARSIILVPLEGGFDHTLDKAGVTIDGPSANSDAVTLYVNEYEEVDHRNDRLTEQAITVVLRDSEKFGDYFKNAAISIDDGTGNPIRINFN